MKCQKDTYRLIKSKENRGNKTVIVGNKIVEYWYSDYFQGEISDDGEDPDFEHIEKSMLCRGRIGDNGYGRDSLWLVEVVVMTAIKTIPVIHPKLENAESIEDVLCLSTLIANGELSPDARLHESRHFFVEEVKEDCGNCPFMLTCLACIINE